MSLLYKLAILPFVYILVTHLLHVFYFAGPSCDSKVMLHGKTVIITGANTGIGRTTAMDMAKRGARVILACRSEKKAAPVVEEIKEKTKNPNVLFMHLDLSSFKSVQKFTDLFLKSEKRLDILINNAGLLTASEDPELNENGIEMSLMVNHLGHFLLTHNLLDLLKKSGTGSRVVAVSSMGHDYANSNAFKDLDNLKIDGFANFVDLPRATFIPTISDLVYPLFQFMWSPAMVRYTNSKLANVLFAKELAKRLKGSGVTTYSLHPGAIMTDFGVDRVSGLDMVGMNRTAYYEMVANLPHFFQPMAFASKTPEEGAQTTICCAVSEEFRDQSGLYYSDCAVREVTRPEWDDDGFSAKFWEWSENLIREAHPIMSP